MVFMRVQSTAPTMCVLSTVAGQPFRFISGMYDTWNFFTQSHEDLLSGACCRQRESTITLFSRVKTSDEIRPSRKPIQE